MPNLGIGYNTTYTSKKVRTFLIFPSIALKVFEKTHKAHKHTLSLMSKSIDTSR